MTPFLPPLTRPSPGSTLLCIGLLFALTGCTETSDRSTKQGIAQMPQVASTIGKGDWRTTYYTDFRGEVFPGDTTYDRYEPLDPNYYNGYELKLSAGDQIRLQVGEADGQFDAVTALYGPQNAHGDWGGAIASNDDSAEGGTYDSLIEFTAPADGTYLVLVREYGWYAGDLYVSASCEGGPCAAAQCPAVMCDLYCEDGFARDANGCETCACAEPDVCPVQPVPANVRCAYVVTWGKNPDTGDCCQYPTPCNVPTGWDSFASEAECGGEGAAREGEACSMYGRACADGLSCEYACPDGSDDPNCNMGINPSGTCVAAAPTGPAECQSDADCMITGCSGQICAAEARATTCEWRPEYACYQEFGSCGCNAGSCGWAPRDDLASCLGS